MEKAKTLNTLVALLKGLEGTIVRIELRHEAALEGRLVSADEHMNCLLERVYYTSARGQHTRFESFFVAGRNIRYVHVPETVDMRAAVESYVERMKRPERREGWVPRGTRFTAAQMKERRKAALQKSCTSMRDQLAKMDA